ncbi:MinD/ParA family ATP-binding protein [Marinobacter koreensis]|uniref:MinD/ParA family ATP-binding protein n=1 Tax=Marinobacter koreensis TaxID=335974 RepID=UPI003A925197
MTLGKHNSHQTRTIVITGGKGGVGKTSVALNLALTLARQGKRVLLLDGDTDLANVSIMIGLYPRQTLANVITGECRLEDTLLEADHGLHIVPGASGVQECLDMTPQDSMRLLRGLGQLEKRYDYVITDTPAGLQAASLHMIAAAELACVVVTPDPASLTDAFSLIKVLKRRGYRRRPSILVNMAQGQARPDRYSSVWILRPRDTSGTGFIISERSGAMKRSGSPYSTSIRLHCFRPPIPRADNSIPSWTCSM